MESKKKNILLVYPKIPQDTYWSFDRILHFVDKRSSTPPLGLITVAAMLPKEYHLRLVDMNVEPLMDWELSWADAVFTSSMIVQKDSLEDVIRRSNDVGVPVVAGGPYPTQYFDMIKGHVDHFVLGEAESGVLESFLGDFEKGEAKRVYSRNTIRGNREERNIDQQMLDNLTRFFGDADKDIQIVKDRQSMSESPIPRFDLLDMRAYAAMAVQMSRGCPYSCEFCNEPTLFGHVPRMKGADQMISEFNSLLTAGYMGSVFIVDDNFTGNKNKVKHVLEEMKMFQQMEGYPLDIYTETDITLANDPEVMSLMRDAGFTMVFIGLESPDREVLRSMGKRQNIRVNLLDSVRKIQSYGMEVSAGFIIGNDNDPPDICDKMFNFCQAAGIPMAMVSLLNAVKGSALYERLKREGRLLDEFVGNNTHRFDLNFTPKNKDKPQIVDEYQVLLDRLYDRKGTNYFQRCRTLMDNLGRRPKPSRYIRWPEVKAFFTSIWEQSFSKSYSKEYRRFIGYCLAQHAKKFPEAVTKAIMGHHFREITRSALMAYAPSY